LQNDISNDDELVDMITQIVKAGKKGGVYIPDVPLGVSNWTDFFNQAKIVRLVSDEQETPHPHEEAEKTNRRLSELETGYQKIVCDLDEIKKKLSTTESLKTEALRQYREKIAGVPEVKKVYYKNSEDGIDFITLFVSSSRVKVLKKIIPINIELDRIYKDVYFDFQISHQTEIDASELDDWTLLYEKNMV
jgi:hypothetical protein